MYCDATGRPHPNGHYQMIDGKVSRRVMQPGEYVSFNMSFMDSAPSANRVFLMDAATFTDAERQFADSAEGQYEIAKAKSDHRLRTAYLGDRAPAWTDAMAAGVIRAASAQKVRTKSFLDQCADDRVRLEAEAAAALHRHKLDLSTRYLNR